LKDLYWRPQFETLWNYSLPVGGRTALWSGWKAFTMLVISGQVIGYAGQQKAGGDVLGVAPAIDATQHGEYLALMRRRD
jgi:hypothetical protein